MQINPRTPTTKNPPEQFTGDVWLDPVASPREEGQRMIVAKVRFAPGARTAWLPTGRGALARRRAGLVHGAPGDVGQRRRPGHHHDVARAPATSSPRPSGWPTSGRVR
jgi:hypothetical protein